MTRDRSARVSAAIPWGTMRIRSLLLAIVLALGVTVAVGCGDASENAAVRQISVDPSGGQYGSIAAALTHLKPGGTLKLAPGTYRLEKPLVVARGVQILGAGMGQTEIACGTSGPTLEFHGGGLLSVQGVTFSHSGTSPASVVIVRSREVAFDRYAFVDAIGKGVDQGVGLLLSGTASGEVDKCRAVAAGRCRHWGPAHLQTRRGRQDAPDLVGAVARLRHGPVSVMAVGAERRLRAGWAAAESLLLLLNGSACSQLAPSSERGWRDADGLQVRER